MVLRRFPAFDNEAFTVAPGSPSLTPGSPIINNSNTPIGTTFVFTGGFEYKPIELDDTSSDDTVFDDDLSGQHIITDGMGLIPDGTPVESESYHFVRALDENGDETGPIITITVFSAEGNTTNIWGMASDAQLLEGVIYKKIRGSNDGDSGYSDFVPCFTAGTRLTGQAGQTRIEDLRAGDKLFTRDNGFREIAWIGSKDLAAQEIAQAPHLAPIRIRAGALGPDNPPMDITVSPNHQLLHTGHDVALNVGAPEAFVAAKFLLGRPGVEVRAGAVRYFHILFDRHEVVLSNGAWTESFLPGPMAMEGIGFDQADEIRHLFPELGAKDGPFQAARQVLTRHEALITA